MKWLLIAASLLLGIGAAGAQVPLPQNVPVPAVPSGLDASGNFTQRLVNFTDLNFGTIYGAQAISTSANTAQWGSAVYVLDADPGYQVNTALQGACLDDGISFVMGFVTALDSSSGSTVLTLDVVIAQGGSPCSNWFFQVINGVTNGVPPTQAIALSTTSFAIPVAGATQSFTVDANKGYSAGSLIFVAALGNSSAWFWMIVQNYNTSTGVVNGFVVQSSQLNPSSPGIFMALGPGALRLSGSAKVYANWAVGMSSTLAPFVAILGFSGTSLTYGSGASQIKQGGVVTMTTQTGLLLNNSNVVVSSSTDSTQYFRGLAQYTTATGALKVYITDVAGSGTFSSWSIFAQDGPARNAQSFALSTTSNTLGAGVFSFTVQSGQFFPRFSIVVISALASPLNYLAGQVLSYAGTTLIVSVLPAGVYGSGTFTAWSIYNYGPSAPYFPVAPGVTMGMVQ
jgi:hypothetical protein